MKFRIFDQILNIISEQQLVATYFSSFSRLHTFEVFEIDEPDEEITNEIKVVISIGHRTELTFMDSCNTFELEIENWESIVQSGSLDNILGQIINFSCLRKKIFPIHSSCVVFQNRAYLFVGPSGAGKTTLAFTLSAINSRYYWTSNDFTGISLCDTEDSFVCLSDDFINFSETSLSSIFASINDKSLEAKILTDPCIEPIFSKSKHFNLSELGLIKSSLPVKLCGLFFVSIKPGGQNLATQCSKKTSVQKLIDELLWVSRGIGSHIISDRGELLAPSLYIKNPLKQSFFCESVNRLVDSCPMWILNSNLEFAQNFVRSIIEAPNEK